MIFRYSKMSFALWTVGRCQIMLLNTAHSSMLLRSSPDPCKTTDFCLLSCTRYPPFFYAHDLLFHFHLHCVCDSLRRSVDSYTLLGNKWNSKHRKSCLSPWKRGWAYSQNWPGLYNSLQLPFENFRKPSHLVSTLLFLCCMVPYLQMCLKIVR
jgi:hypothetical protein